MIRNILISSVNRNTGNPQNFHLTFDEPIRNVNKVKLLNCSIPVTWYNIRTGNLTATLAEGNYSVSDLVVEIKNALDTAVQYL